MGQDMQRMKAIKTGQALSHPPLNVIAHTNVIINQQFVKLIQYSLATPSRQNCKRWEQQIKQYFYNVDTSLLYLPTRYHYKSTEYCGGAGIMNIYYQYYPITLQTEIASRMERRSLFSQEQIWGLFYTLCAAASHLHAKDKKLGKVALEHVFINPESSRIKIATGLSFFSDTAIDEILAPESIVFSRGVINKNSAKLEQAYSIGIVTICAMLLIPKDQAMQIIKRPHQNLNKVIMSLKNEKVFSNDLKKLVIKMIDLDPIQRITPMTVVEHLQPYEQLIIGGCKPPSQAVTEILEEDNQRNNRPSKLLRVTLGTPLIQFSNQQQEQEPPSNYSKNIKNSIEKTQSQYVSTKPQKITSQQKNQLDQFLNMVDRHLQNSRNSYHS